MNKQCGACGARKMKRFEDETFVLEHEGMTETVKHLRGWRCAECSEVLFDVPSAQIYAQASDRLVEKARENEAAEIRRIRRRLGLTQEQAAILTGGGPNAFSRYETGKTRALPAVLNLLRLLDAHPEQLSELPGAPSVGSKERRRHAAA